MADISRKGDIDVNIVDGAANTYKAGVTSTGRLKVDNGMDISTPGYMILRDYANASYTASVDSSGNLRVITPPPTPPVDTTGVSVTEYDDVSTTSDNVYVIPSGKNFVIQRLNSGAETGNGGSVIELWYDPLGTGSGMIIIDSIHCDGSSDQHDLNYENIGDGTKSIRMRRKRYGGGAVEIFARWEGYYYD